MQRAPNGLLDTEANAFPKDTHRIGRLPLVTWSQNGRVLTSDTRRSLAVRMRHSSLSQRCAAHTVRLHARLLSRRDQPRWAVMDAAPHNHKDKASEPGLRCYGERLRVTDQRPPSERHRGALVSGHEQALRSPWRLSPEQMPQGLPATRYSQHAPCRSMCHSYTAAPFHQRISCQPQDRFTLSQGQAAGQASSTSTLVVTGQVSA